MFKGKLKLSQSVALLAAALSTTFTTVHAALPTEVTTEVATAKVDIAQAGALGIGIFLSIMIFLWLRRVMR